MSQPQPLEEAKPADNIVTILCNCGEFVVFETNSITTHTQYRCRQCGMLWTIKDK